MPKRIAPLTDTKVRTTKPTEKPQKLFDGGGLFLLVTPTGGRLWRFKYRFGGSEKLLSIGTYPETSLAEARQRRDQASALLANGIDPSETKKAQKAAGNQETETFEIIAREWYAKFSPSWATSHAKTTIRRACHISTRIALGIPLSNSARIFARPRNSSRRGAKIWGMRKF